MEALLRSLPPLNIICDEPLKSGSMDQNLIDEHLDEPCGKSDPVNIYLHMEDCRKSRTDVFGGSDRFLIVHGGVR